MNNNSNSINTENAVKPKTTQKKGSSIKVSDYMMYIALAALFIIFTVATDFTFISGTNLANLINQSGYVAILAIGMTSILILKHIDLSVGFVAGFSGAIAAILITEYDLDAFSTIIIVLLVGLLIGLYHGTLVTIIGIPAFVVTLASMFIFRGALSLTLAEKGSVKIPNDTFNNLSNGYIPDFKDLGLDALDGGEYHLLTIVIGVIFMVLVTLLQIKDRKTKIKYKFNVSSIYVFIAKLLFLNGMIAVLTGIFTTNRGIPWTAVIVCVVLFIFNFMLTKTKLGRYIYGIGGNDQAAELSGISVKKVTMFAFCAMSVLAALAGILYTSRLKSASPAAGVGFEMDAIASGYIGGVAVSGGVGKVTNTIIGTLVIMSLTNGMNLMGINISYQYIVKGLIFILAVAVDVRSRKVAK